MIFEKFLIDLFEKIIVATLTPILVERIREFIKKNAFLMLYISIQ